MALLLCSGEATSATSSDNLTYCNAVQNKVGFIRYPLGTIGVWTTASGEIADAITRVPRIYPCLGTVKFRAEKDEWRASITGDPSILNITYRADKPCGKATSAITVSPHVAVFKVAFPETTTNKYLILDFSKMTVDNWARLYRWTDRKATWVDNRTLQVSVGEPGKNHAYYIVKFDTPGADSGCIDSTGEITAGDISAVGTNCCAYARFNTSVVTVAVAESFSSFDNANKFLEAEFKDFESVHHKCHAAWDAVLDRAQIAGSENSKRMAYTALYTIYANIIDGSDGSCYSRYYSRPRSVASSDYWQFIGGYQSCCWDNVRATYPLLAVAYPEVMADVINTYFARYQRDGCLDGDICLFTGPSGHNNVRFVPTLFAFAWQAGVQADYSKLYAALKDNFGNDAYFPPSILKTGHMVQPESGGFACSRTLEYADGLHSLAMLAKENGDQEPAGRYYGLSKCYTNLWDSTDHVFRVRAADGSWGPETTHMTWNPNPAGLFEGSSRDWMFGVAHDPYGMIELHGQKDFITHLIGYCTNGMWFNDYQEIYPYLLYYAGVPGEAQRLIRTSWLPLFKEGVMYEGVKATVPHGGWNDHYSGGSGWLLCSMLGLYPTFAPAGQFIISSPSIDKAVIHHEQKHITIQAKNNSEENIYIRSIKVNGKPYPAYMIPAKRLAAGAKIELEMGNDPAAGLGNCYVSSSDGFILSAELTSDSHLKCVIEAPVTDATTKIFSRTKPAQITLNGRADAHAWSYDEAQKTITVHSMGKTEIEVL